MLEFTLCPLNHHWIMSVHNACIFLFLPTRASEQGNWRASEASETLFSHVYGNSRYIYILYVRLFLIRMRALVFC